MSFEKVFKIAKSSIKTTTDIAISNGMNFSVQIVPLQNTEGEFPPSEQVYEFIEAYIKETMKYKELNPRALEGMRKKWEKTHGSDVPFVPKLQPSELIVVLISPSDEGIHLFCSIPKTISFKLSEKYSEEQWEQDNRVIHYASVQSPEGTTMFKYRDELSTEIIQDLKVQGVYVDEESDDEEPYCLNDL